MKLFSQQTFVNLEVVVRLGMLELVLLLVQMKLKAVVAEC